MNFLHYQNWVDYKRKCQVSWFDYDSYAGWESVLIGTCCFFAMSLACQLLIENQYSIHYLLLIMNKTNHEYGLDRTEKN